MEFPFLPLPTWIAVELSAGRMRDSELKVLVLILAQGKPAVVEGETVTLWNGQLSRLSGAPSTATLYGQPRGGGKRTGGIVQHMLAAGYIREIPRAPDGPGRPGVAYLVEGDLTSHLHQHFSNVEVIETVPRIPRAYTRARERAATSTTTDAAKAAPPPPPEIITSLVKCLDLLGVRAPSQALEEHGHNRALYALQEVHEAKTRRPGWMPDTSWWQWTEGVMAKRVRRPAVTDLRFLPELEALLEQERDHLPPQVVRFAR